MHPAVRLPLAVLAALAASAARGASPSAADPSAPAAITWAACLAEARAANSTLAEARFRLDASLARQHQAVGGFLPEVSASLGTSAGADAPPWFRPLAFGPGRSSLNASESLFAGFSTWSEVLAATAAVRSQRAQLAAASAQVRESLRQAFVGLLFAQETLRVQADITGRRRANADLVRLRYEAGREDEGSMLRAAADARQADHDLAVAGRALRLARDQLALGLGRDRGDGLAAGGGWDAPDPPADPDLDALAGLTPAVRGAQADDDGARAQVLGARAPFWPSLSVNAGVSGSAPSWPFADNPAWSAGAAVSWSLFNGGRDWFALEAARAGARQSGEALVRIRRETRVGLEAALFGFTDADDNVRVQAQFLDAATTRALIARAQYANGTLGYVDWDLIETDLVAAQRDDVAARRDANLAAAAWDRARGVGLEAP